MSIPFTQFLMPDGRREEITIERSEHIEAKARILIEAGFRFEIEMLSDYRTISATIADLATEQDAALELAPNGPKALLAIDRMIENFSIEKWKQELSEQENENFMRVQERV